MKRKKKILLVAITPLVLVGVIYAIFNIIPNFILSDTTAPTHDPTPQPTPPILLEHIDYEQESETEDIDNVEYMYGRPWSDVRQTSEGRALTEVFEEAFRETRGQVFFWFHHIESYMTRNVTYEALRDAFEEVMDGTEIVTLRFYNAAGTTLLIEREYILRDWTPLLEVTGVEPAYMWLGTERFESLENDFRYVFGRGFGIHNPNQYESSLPVGDEVIRPRMYLEITIDRLEEVARWSIEDGVNLASAVIHGW